MFTITHSTQPIDRATPLDDMSGLVLPIDKVYALREIYEAEANNIAIATLKYLSALASKNGHACLSKILRISILDRMIQCL